MFSYYTVLEQPTDHNIYLLLVTLNAFSLSQKPPMMIILLIIGKERVY